MKKAKRIIALVLVMTFVFAFMAMSASAATARGVACDKCGSSNTTWSNYSAVAGTQYVGSCSRLPNSSHYHIIYQPMRKFTCKACGYSYSYATGSTYVECHA